MIKALQQQPIPSKRKCKLKTPTGKITNSCPQLLYFFRQLFCCFKLGVLPSFKCTPWYVNNHQHEGYLSELQPCMDLLLGL